MGAKHLARIATLDIETDPFLHGRNPQPFAVGFKWGDTYCDWWGDDCVARAVGFIEDIETPLIIYAHNGGKFDFMFLLEHVSNPIKVIHGRIAKAKLGKHELRDSWLINPQPLSRYKKDEIDYSTFERDVRDKHRARILAYLQGDCTYLYEICLGFAERFGARLTMPGAAMSALAKLHPQERGGKAHDTKFRPWYFGGRVECFSSGVQPGDWRVYDVNSMYPYVMREFPHPAGLEYVEVKDTKVTADGWIVGHVGAMYFAEVEGVSHGAFPLRNTEGLEKGGLAFPRAKGTYHVTSHECRMAIALGLFECSRVVRALIPIRRQTFAAFVDTFMADKLKAEECGDAIGRLFAKLVLNSGYGKFGQDPEAFREYWLERIGIDPRPILWHPPMIYPAQGIKIAYRDGRPLMDGEPYLITERYRVWRTRSRKDSPDNDKRGYFDVAIAASVTGAARAVLMHAIHSSRRIAYCDTDSVICEGLAGVQFDAKRLGAWKEEGNGDQLAVAGKKLYCLMWKGEPVKWASKGLKLSPEQIIDVSQGATVHWRNDAPSYDLTGTPRFVSRNARSTLDRPKKKPQNPSRRNPATL